MEIHCELVCVGAECESAAHDKPESASLAAVCGYSEAEQTVGVRLSRDTRPTLNESDDAVMKLLPFFLLQASPRNTNPSEDQEHSMPAPRKRSASPLSLSGAQGGFLAPHLTRMSYRIGRSEQGVLTFEPYKSHLLPMWRFKTPEIARESAQKIEDEFMKFEKGRDFVGCDMARKFLQMCALFSHTRKSDG